MRTRSVLIILLVFFISSFVLCNAKNVLSEKDKEKISMISKVKKFEESLGLKPTNNFKEYREDSNRYNLFFYNKKTEVPFSYIDPLLSYEQSDYDNLASSVFQYKIDLSKNDVYFYTTLGIASGSFITRNLLDSEDAVIADVVFHEDMHDNTNLPRHIDEATALIVGIAGSAMFMKSEEEDFYCLMEYIVGEATHVKSLHNGILEINTLYKNRKMPFETYLTIRDLRLGVSGQDSMAGLAQNHTYFCYVPILMRLFSAMNYDLKRFVVFMKEFPYKEPSTEQEQEAYFKETLMVEEEATAFLETTIAELEKTNIKEKRPEPQYQNHFFLSIDLIYLKNNLKKTQKITNWRHLKPFCKK